MNYTIDFSSQAKRFLRGLGKKHRYRVLCKFDEIRKDPVRFLEHFEGGGYKARIGAFRALIDVVKRTLKVRVVDKRGRIYTRYG